MVAKLKPLVALACLLFVAAWPATSRNFPPPPLDGFSTQPVHAYSLRRLKTSYSGSAINVRRVSDSATKDIGFRNGALDLSTLGIFCLATDCYVTTWYDQIGASNLTAPSGQQPRIASGGLIDNTLPDHTPAMFFGWNTSLVNNGTNNIGLINSLVPTYGTGDIIVVFANPYHGPGIVAQNVCPGGICLAADVLLDTPSSFQGLATDHQGITPGSNAWPNDDNEPVTQNNLTGVQGNSFGTNTNIQMTYGGANTQVRWSNLQSSNGGINVGRQVITSIGDAWLGYVMEAIIYGGSSFAEASQRTPLFANQQSFYHISISNISDAVSEQMDAGYSTRLLRKSYFGAALQVREDVGNTTQDIGFDSGGNLNTTALINFCTGNGAHPTANCFVTKWYDQSPWANLANTNAVQATNANQPQIVLNGAVVTQGPNNRPVLWFNESATGTINLQSTAGSGSSGNTWWGGIVNYTGSTGLVSTLPTPVAVFSSGSWGGVFQLSNNQTFWQSSTGTISVNNTGSTTPVSGFIQIALPLGGGQGGQIAFSGQPGTGSTSWTGYIGELVGFSSTMPTSDIALLYNNQKNYWGTP